MEKELRIVSISGKFSLRECLVDEDGYVESVLDAPDTKYKSLAEMKAFLEAAGRAGKMAVTVINSSNRSELIRSERWEG